MIDKAYRAAQEALFDAIFADSGGACVVPVRTQYNNAAHGLGVLTFLPRTLAEPIAARLQTEFAGATEPHHWYEPGAMHVTAKNIRVCRERPTFGEQEVRAASSVLTTVTPTAPPLEFELCGLVRFPSSLAIRAFAQPTYTAPPCDDLLRRIERMREFPFGRFTLTALHLVSCDEVCSQQSRSFHLVAYRRGASRRHSIFFRAPVLAFLRAMGPTAGPRLSSRYLGIRHRLRALTSNANESLCYRQ